MTATSNLLFRLFILTMLFLALGYATLRASVVVTTNASAPSSSYISNSTGGSGMAWRNDITSGRRNVGQSFYVADNVTLDSFTLQFVTDSNIATYTWSNATFTVSVYEMASASATTPSTLVTSDTGDLSVLGSGGITDKGKYVTFDMSNVSLTAGKYYSIVLAFTSAAATNQTIAMNISTANTTYTGGQAIYTTNGTAYSTWNADLVFFVNTVAIPEPKTASLGIIGILLLAGYGLKRKFQTA